ncbi:CGNR zinc finger domain-containing protein [Pseudonocardia sp. KRD-184]|uniref:CGNR zinc finger domain-containing protein n=1 Tax=Pseudonocardia oceani TaxID=2792013 RepID=A0ABS6U8Q0_9PSEU|nr:CGNR zinc finger domain-containing protein [Pseudonocardia oceani]MBW0095937.1 CGNR zinc finger domain-containing protein [Pseudonocardia oceani]MBW0108650.1 CGNR zinc finger domain-containing protein [Pseudonocardia oceani]MBW0122778.1 CGNR zinc finger domain-containing protein [Pseudonocardia oceani]MBW0128620.1 CGNR zinc finger domain-containing protein [Pseudonocardia oceani]
MRVGRPRATGRASRSAATPVRRAAFFDRSRNGSGGVWCSMAVCGSDTKNRAFAERRRARSRAG